MLNFSLRCHEFATTQGKEEQNIWQTSCRKMEEVRMGRVCLQRDYHVYFGIIKFNYFFAQVVSFGDARNTYQMKQCGHWCLYFFQMPGEIRFNCNPIQLQVKLPNCKRVMVPHNRKWPFQSLIFQGDGHLRFSWDRDFDIRSLTSIFFSQISVFFGKWPVFGHILIIIYSLSVFKSQSSIFSKVNWA